MRYCELMAGPSTRTVQHTKTRTERETERGIEIVNQVRDLLASYNAKFTVFEAARDDKEKPRKTLGDLLSDSKKIDVLAKFGGALVREDPNDPYRTIIIFDDQNITVRKEPRYARGMKEEDLVERLKGAKVDVKEFMLDPSLDRSAVSRLLRNSRNPDIVNLKNQLRSEGKEELVVEITIGKPTKAK